MNLLKAVNNGRRGAETIQQPAPVFFSPEQEKRMVAGYQYKAPEKSTEDRMIDEIRQTMADLRQTANRMKVVVKAREEELAKTQTQLRECVKELCRMCGDDQHPENGTCKTCRWHAVKECNA